MPSETDEILNTLKALAQEFSQPRLAMIYAHSGDEFVQAMLAHSSQAIYYRGINADGSPEQYRYFTGLPIITQPFLLPGTAMMIDQYGQIMKVVRYGHFAPTFDRPIE